MFAYVLVESVSIHGHGYSVLQSSRGSVFAYVLVESVSILTVATAAPCSL